jgi:hypothetical protein
MRIWGLTIGFSMLACAGGAMAADSSDVSGVDNPPSGAAMAADLMVARPLGFAATALGAGVFVIGLPLEALTGSISSAEHRLVTEPAKYTFSRPLGEMH